MSTEKPTAPAVEVEPGTNKACIECAQGIPLAAKKCAKCGSYQDWRRHLPFSQATLAVFLSMLALVGTFVGGGRAVVQRASEVVYGKGPPVEVALVGISEDQASLFLSSRSAYATLVSGFQCEIYLPIDWNSFADQLLGIRSGAEYMRFRNKPLRKEETLGLFLLSYQVEPNVVLRPEDQSAIVGKLKHVSPPLETVSSANSHPDDPVTSFCFVNGVDEHNEVSPGSVFLMPRDLLDFDVIDVLQKADFSTESEPKRAELIAMVEATRKANKDAKAGTSGADPPQTR